MRRLLSAGQLDPMFAVGGVAHAELFPGGNAAATAIQADGKIIVAGGTAPSSENTGIFALARFESNGLIDRAFGNNGRIITHLGRQSQIAAVAVQADGKIVAAGYDRAGVQGAEVAVVRYLPDGELDKSFGSGGESVFPVLGASDVANAMVIEADGKIIVGGYSIPMTEGPKVLMVARLTNDGALDPTFGNNGTITTGLTTSLYGSSIDALALQPNGDIVAAGSTTVDGVTCAALARYLPDGSLDGTFGTGGTDVETNLPSVQSNVAINPRADGSIIVGAYADAGAIWVSRLNAAGAVDPAFGTGGATGIPSSQVDPGGAFALEVQANGAIVTVATEFQQTSDTKTYVRPPSDFLLARFTPDGVLDTSFGSAGETRTDLSAGPVTRAAALQPDGKIIVLGDVYLGNGIPYVSGSPSRFAAARYMPNGRLDDTFGFHGAQTDPDGFAGPINAIAVQPDGKILVAGSELAPDPTKWNDAAIARYNADGSLDTSFGVDGRFYIRIGNDAVFNSLLIQPDGKIVAGGSGQVRGTPDFLVVRINADGSYDHSFDGTGVAQMGFAGFSQQSIASMAFAPGGDIVVGGSATDPTGKSAFAVARYLPNGRLDPAFAYGGRIAGHPLGESSAAHAVSVLPAGRIILAGAIGDNFGMVRLTPKGTYDTSFGNGGVVTTTMLDPTYHSALISAADAMTLDSRGRIVRGGGTGSGFTALARYLPTGSLDPSFGTQGILVAPANDGSDGSDISQINAVAVQSGGAIVIGGMDANGNALVARVTDQSLDPTFGTDGVTRLYDASLSPFPINALALEPDGSILAGGTDVYKLLGA
ncbi:MAG TPA: hypothetical protein VFC78_03505 [Tepidisphaeraceae bacterium]|nr:hypothetical protein [Tepidisphaeraceae bacterium]